MKNASVWAIVMAMAILVAGLIGTSQAGVSNRIAIQISPNTLVLGQTMEYVTVHTNIACSLVDRDSVELNRIPVAYVKSDNRGFLVAKFDADAVKAIVKPGRAKLTMTGTTVNGVNFFGTDIIAVKR